MYSKIKGLVRSKECILDKQLPLDHLIVEHEYSLQRLLSEGITINDFINNGYSYNDLEFYPSIRDRKLKTLIALKCNAEHFKNGYIPIEGITSRDIIEWFGLYFPPNCGPLSTEGGQNNTIWKASDLVKLGFKMQDLFDAGLEYYEQYQDLDPTRQDEAKMDIPLNFIDELPSYNPEPTYVPTPAPAPVQVPVRTPMPRYIVPQRRKRYHGFKKK